MKKKNKGGRVTIAKVDYTWTPPKEYKERYDGSYILPRHVCTPRSSLGVPHNHFVPEGTEWKCSCDKNWKITKHHVGKNCGCGWENTSS